MVQSVVSSEGQPYLLEPITTTRLPIRAAHALASLVVDGFPVRLLNQGVEPVTPKKGTKVTQLKPIDGLTIGQVIEGDTTENSTARDTLTPEMKMMLKQMIHDTESQLTELDSKNFSSSYCPL